MAKPNARAEASRRLRALARDIRSMRIEAAQGMEPESVRHLLDLGAIIHQHAQISRNARARGASRRYKSPALDTDVEAIERSVRRWRKRRQAAARG